MEEEDDFKDVEDEGNEEMADVTTLLFHLLSSSTRMSWSVLFDCWSTLYDDRSLVVEFVSFVKLFEKDVSMLLLRVLKNGNVVVEYWVGCSSETDDCIEVDVDVEVDVAVVIVIAVLLLSVIGRSNSVECSTSGAVGTHSVSGRLAHSLFTLR